MGPLGSVLAMCVWQVGVHVSAFFILLENIIADDENASLASDLFLLPLL